MKELSIQEEKRQYDIMKEIFDWKIVGENRLRIDIEVNTAITLVFEYQRNHLTSWVEISTGTMGFDQAWDNCSIREDPIKWMQKRVDAINTLFGKSKLDALHLPEIQ